MHAAQNLQDCRLAGAVLTEQCVHFARANVEMNVVKRPDTAETHADISHSDGFGCVGSVHDNT
ncbi:hypothetical protein MesoLj113a_66110 [Mesorhizobium sp. 113-1-2]|nr:hypothetical protein MesoLj113a_66110 [Mesorhizobium sp. 113-1-2]